TRRSSPCGSPPINAYGTVPGPRRPGTDPRALVGPDSLVGFRDGSAEQAQDALGQRVRLAEHGRTGLEQDLVTWERHQLGRHVGVAEPGLRGGEVLRGDLQVRDGRFEAVLERTELAAGVRDLGDRGVDRRDGRTGIRGDVDVDHVRVTGVRASGGEAQRHGRGRRDVDREGVALVRTDLEVAGEGAVQQLLRAALRGVGDAGDLLGQLLDLRLRSGTSAGVVGAGVRRLHGQVTDAVEHGVDLVQGALSGLHDRDAVLGVAGGLTEPGDLRTQTLADDEAGGVVSRTVDPEPGRELLEALAHRRVGGGQVPVGVERLDVLVDAHALLLRDQ